MIIFAAMLALFTGQAMAQRTLPGMRSVEVKANMVDGFYTGSARNCGYSFGVYYSVFKGNNAHEWVFGGEYLQTYKSYGEKGRIPVAEFTGEAEYNLTFTATIHSSFTSMEESQLLPDMRRSTGVRRFYPTVQHSTTRTPLSMVERSTFRLTSISQTESPSPPTSKRDSFSVIQRGTAISPTDWALEL